MNFDLEARASLSLGQLCRKVYKKCKLLHGDQNSAELVLLLLAIEKETEKLSYSVRRVTGLLALIKDCENVLMDLEKSLEMISRRNLDISQLEIDGMDSIRSRLTWDLSNIRAFNKSYVEPAHMFIGF